MRGQEGLFPIAEAGNGSGQKRFDSSFDERVARKGSWKRFVRTFRSKKEDFDRL